MYQIKRGLPSISIHYKIHTQVTGLASHQNILLLITQIPLQHIVTQEIFMPLTQQNILIADATLTDLNVLLADLPTRMQVVRITSAAPAMARFASAPTSLAIETAGVNVVQHIEAASESGWLRRSGDNAGDGRTSVSFGSAKTVTMTLANAAATPKGDGV